MSKKRVKELEELIVFHKNLYYSGQKQIEDEEYDELENELRSLDPQNKVLEIVGSQIISGDSITHDKKMLSLDKKYSIDELLKWRKDFQLMATLKVDGSSGSVIYNKGIFKLGKTRGDGVSGENITSKCQHINFPKTLSKLIDLEIRGEIYCTEDNFFKLSAEMEKRKLRKPTSQRNIVAGILGRKDHVDLAQYLSFMAYEVVPNNYKTEEDIFDFLANQGFVLPFPELMKTEEDVRTYILKTNEKLLKNDFLIDGAVFTINDVSVQKEQGYTSHHPKYKMAFKIQGETKNTKIINIDWQISQFGIYTPVANLEPVELKGVVISKVTLHNYKTVKEFNLKSNDTIKIVRSGEVIPKFLEVIHSSNNETELPTKCLYCKTKLTTDDVRLICPNINCDGRKLEQLISFIQKIGIDDLSEKRIQVMVENGLVSDIKDFYLLTVNDILSLPNTKEKMATKLYTNIQKSKTIDIISFFDALGLAGGAKNKIELLLNAGFNTLDKILNVTIEDLLPIKGFAETGATLFLNSIEQKLPLIEELLHLGFNIQLPIPVEKTSELLNLSLCITGETSKPRAELEKILESFGATTTSSISKKLSYLICNEISESSKTKKAKELNIPIISEDDLKKKFNIKY